MQREFYGLPIIALRYVKERVRKRENNMCIVAIKGFMFLLDLRHIFYHKYFDSLQ